MNTQQWINYFHRNAATCFTPDWTQPCEMPAGPARQALIRSLAIFQLGETGDGSTVQRWARQAARCDSTLEGYPEAERLFIAEENAHAALLAEMIAHLGGKLRRRQWTAWLFGRVRKLVPRIEFEIQILLIAELIARAYYGLLSHHVPDVAIRAAASRLVHDEVQHISFHVDFFRERLGNWLPLLTGLWRTQFQVLFLTAERLVWWDHQAALRSIGVTRGEFERRSRAACRDFLQRTSGGNLMMAAGIPVRAP
jgi:hypothetical protein